MLEIFRRPEADYLNIYPGVISLQGEVWNKGIFAGLQYGWLSLNIPPRETKLIEFLFDGAIKTNLCSFRFYAENRASGMIQSEIVNPLFLKCFPG